MKILNLSEFILNNFRNNVPWSVYQGSRCLAKGNEMRDDVFNVIKATEIHIPTDEELAKEIELKEKKYQERMEKLKKAKKEKAEADKLKMPEKIKSKKKKGEVTFIPDQLKTNNLVDCSINAVGLVRKFKNKETEKKEKK